MAATALEEVAARDERWIAASLARLSLVQKIGQMLIGGFQGTTFGPDAGSAIESGHLGGLIFFRWNLGEVDQVRRLTAEMQNLALDSVGLPLFLAIDQEGGAVSRLTHPASLVPSAMAIGATGDGTNAEACAAILASHLAQLGFNVNFGSVLDVNTNAWNPVIGTRSYGDSPALVAEMGTAAIRAHHPYGVLATAKHFPGHGDTFADSHRALPVVHHQWDRLQMVELPPFQAAIDAGVDMVLTSHVVFPSLDVSCCPATLSPRILKGLLREKMGFQGLVVSDAIEMDAIAHHYGVAEAAVQAARAGVDLILSVADRAGQEEIFWALLTAVEDGTIPVGDIDASVARILRAKYRLLPSSAGMKDEGLSPQTNRRLIQEIAQQSITLVRDREGLLPFRLEPSQRLGLLDLQASHFSPVEDGCGESPAGLLIRRYHPNTVSVVVEEANPEAPETIRTLAAESDVLLVITRSAIRHPSQASFARQILRTGKPTALLAARSPYDLLAFPKAPCFVASYCDQPCSLEAAIDALFGKSRFRGRLPVALAGLYPAGHGLGVRGSGADRQRFRPE